MPFENSEDVFHRVVRQEGYWGRYEPIESDNGIDGLIGDARRLINDSFAEQQKRIIANGVHPDLHFDVIEADDNEVNALAFIEEGWAMVGITQCLFTSLYSLFEIACQDRDLVQSFELDSNAPGTFEILVLLYTAAVNFAANHELGHLVHGHCSVPTGHRPMRREVLPPAVARSGMRSQAEEVEADGYATHMSLQSLLCSPARDAAANQLGVPTNHVQLDEVLLRVFLTAVVCFFHCLHIALIAEDVELGSHPFELLRINVVITDMQGWSARHRPRLANWPSPDEFARLGNLVRNALSDSSIKDTWDTQSSFLQSDAGQQYRDRLYHERESLREQMEPLQWRILREQSDEFGALGSS